MPFDYRRNLTFNPINPQTLQSASRSPFEIAGNAMTNLEQTIDDRAFEKQIGKAQTLEDLAGLTPTTAKSQALLSNRANVFNALGQQAQRDRVFGLQQQQADLAQAKAIPAIQLATSQAKQFDEAQRRLQEDELARVGQANVQAQTGLPEFSVDTGGFTGFTALSPVDKISAEITTLGKSPTLELVKAQAKSTKDRKPTNPEEMDRWFNEAQGIRALGGNATQEQKQRLNFLERGITKYQAGTGTVAQDINEQQLQEDFTSVQGFKDKFGANPASAKSFDLGEMKTFEDRSFGNLDTNQKSLLKDTTKSLKANQVFIDGVSQVLDDHVKNKTIQPDKGLIDNTIQKFAEVTGVTGEQVRTNIDFNSRSGRLLGAYMKATSGLAVSDAEREFLTGLFTGGFLDNEQAIVDRMNSFQDSMIDENNILAGQIFDSAPYSATKYRKYKEYEAFEPSVSIPTINTPTQFSVGQRATQGGKTYQFDGTNWKEL